MSLLSALVAVGILAATADAKLTAHFQQTRVSGGRTVAVVLTSAEASPVHAALVRRSNAWAAERGNTAVLLAIAPAVGFMHSVPSRASISTQGLSRGTYLLVLRVQQPSGKWLSYVPALFVQHRTSVTLHIS